jgi:hypothetical protein|tara:strand:+ start:416 stop:1009 length:594 start_codon:yes stop_codon:yes gene_type:complete
MSSDIQSTFISAAVASATAISTAAGVGNNAALVLVGGSPFTLDAARKITITSAGDDSGKSFTIVGLDQDGNAATESLVGADTGVVTSAGYYTSITSITAVGNPAANVSAGTSNSVAAPIFGGRLRLKGLYAVNTATAGTITFRETSPTGNIRMQFATVASATTSEYPDVPDDGILFKDGGYIDYSPANMSSITVFYA